MIPVALVGATPVSAALAELVRQSEDCELALRTDRATDDHLAQTAGESGVVVLDLPAGESRELVRALGARGIRVVDLGPDLRVPQVTCGFDESYVVDKRLVSLPSAGTMAAACAAEELLHGDRLQITVIESRGSLRLEGVSKVSEEFSWMLEQRGAQRARRISTLVQTQGEGLLALVQGELGNPEAQDPALLKKTQLYGPDWLRATGAPDCARVAGTGIAEVSATADAFCEWILASCAIDPVAFPAHAALRAVRAMAG